MRRFSCFLFVFGSVIAASASHANQATVPGLAAIPAHAVLSDQQMAQVEGRVAPVGAAAIGAVAGAVAGAVSSYAATGEVSTEAVLGGAATGVTGAIGALATAGASVSALGVAYWTAVSSIVGAAAAAAGESYDSLADSLADLPPAEQNVVDPFGVLGAWAASGSQWNVYFVSASAGPTGPCGICYTKEWL